VCGGTYLVETMSCLNVRLPSLCGFKVLHNCAYVLFSLKSELLRPEIRYVTNTTSVSLML